MTFRLFLAVIAAVILDAARTARDRYRDEAITRLESAPFPGCIRVSRDQVSEELPLPVRVPGAALDWEGHAAAALAVAREAVAGDFAEWEAQLNDGRTAA